jgi:hypothetical protein
VGKNKFVGCGSLRVPRALINEAWNSHHSPTNKSQIGLFL